MGTKILLISNNGLGFYNFKKELVEKLLYLNYEVHFAAPFDEKLKDLMNDGAFFHNITIDRRGANPFKDISLMRQFHKLIKKIRPDVMVLHTIKPNIYSSMLAKIFKIPYLNNITGLGSAFQNESYLAQILHLMYKYSLAKSSGIFFENVGNLEYFRTNHIGNQKQYYIVPGAGVNLDHFRPIIKKEHRDETVFLYIGRIMKDKGIDEFFQASEYIRNKYSNVKFQVVGFYDDPKYKDQVCDLVERRIIDFLGLSKDTRTEMSQADCIVLPSYHEGMSNVLLEGAAMGLPLITTDIHGCKEAVDHGKNGFLCKKADVDSLIQAMEEFIALSSEERLQMGRYGREKMEREFDRETVVDRYVQCIQSAIKEQ